MAKTETFKLQISDFKLPKRSKGCFILELSGPADLDETTDATKTLLRDKGIIFEPASHLHSEPCSLLKT